jgi:hypothetical protein
MIANSQSRLAAHAADLRNANLPIGGLDGANQEIGVPRLLSRDAVPKH